MGFKIYSTAGISITQSERAGCPVGFTPLVYVRWRDKQR